MKDICQWCGKEKYIWEKKNHVCLYCYQTKTKCDDCQQVFKDDFITTVSGVGKFCRNCVVKDKNRKMEITIYP